MQTEPYPAEMNAAAPVLLMIHGAEWRFSIVNVTRIGSALLVRVALAGPETCEVVVRVSGGYVSGDTARQILDAACAWLLRRGVKTRGVLDVGSSGFSDPSPSTRSSGSSDSGDAPHSAATRGVSREVF
jgi:hypothetical protein